MSARTLYADLLLANRIDYQVNNECPLDGSLKGLPINSNVKEYSRVLFLLNNVLRPIMELF